jgi:hypothetical protein
MEATIWFAGLSLTAIGALATSIEYRRKIRNLNKAHQAELQSQFHYAFNAGWEGALQSPTTVRERYDQLFNRH